jgi:hypothetical protein
MSRPYYKDVICSECSEVTEVAVIPYKPADRRGRFERAEPSEGGTLEPAECDCGQGFNYEEEA